MTQKNCLLVKSKDLMLDDVLWGLHEEGHNCDSFELSCKVLDFDEAEAERLVKYIEQSKTDVVFTMNFSPTVSFACNTLSIPYASWLYDCPLQSLFDDEAHNPCNYFFVFDKYLLQECIDRKLQHASYLPLAANITRTGQLVITAEDEADFSCDLSFVGMQYIDGRYSYYRSKLDDHYKNELDNIAYDMIGRWDGIDRIHNRISNELLGQLLDLSSEDPNKKLGIPNKSYFEEVVIARAVAYTERRLMMEAIKDFTPIWYGADAKEKDQIPGVLYKPFLKYLNELPKAYNLSKINLATTLHSIFSGASLRTFDIIGAGGFILTNYQPELGELFDIGKEIVVYHDFEEMRELVKFFLSHENERLSILMAGYERVCNEYTYPIAVTKMLKAIFA